MKRNLLFWSKSASAMPDSLIPAYLDGADIGMAIVSADGSVVETNVSYDALFDSAADIGLPTELSGKDYICRELSLQDPDGRVRWIRTTLTRASGQGQLIRIAEDITAMKAAERSVRVDELGCALRRAIEAVQFTTSIQQVFDTLLPSVRESFGWDAATYWEVTGEPPLLCRVSSSFKKGVELPRSEAMGRRHSIKPGVGLTGKVWESNRPQWLQDISGDSNAAMSLKAEQDGVKTAFCFPVVESGLVRGVVELCNLERLAPDSAVIEAAARLGRDIGRQLASADILHNVKEQLRASESHRIAVSDMVQEAIISITEDSHILSVNPATEQLFGYTPGELLGKPITKLMPDDVRQAHRDAVALYRQSGSRRIAWNGSTVTGRRKDGSTVLLQLCLTEASHEGRRTFTGCMRDITERTEETSALQHQALHDALTGLPNRALLEERLERSISVSKRYRRPVALLFMDLDRFKEVNDTFGHHYGDDLLRQVAERLRETLRESDTIARLGGDEFALLLPQTEEPGALQVAERIEGALKERFTVNTQDLEVAASIGIAMFPDHGESATELMQRADIAMYAAKRSAAGCSVYYSERDDVRSHRLVLMGELREAIANNELVLHYQPKMRLEDGNVDQVEALVRWQHPSRGFMPPDAFIGLAEETGLITPLTVWVLREALRQRQRLLEIGLDIGMSVNFSAQMLHNRDLIEVVGDLLEATHTEPSQLQIEVTESGLMVDPDRGLATLAKLRSAGVWTSIDDFGTGYSSLAYLKRLPIDELKIDKSFVLEMASSRDDASIVSSVVTLGHNLGLRVVAEGVEDKRSLDMLRSMDCDLAQGFFLSRPLAAAALTVWLQARLPVLSTAS